MKGILTMKQITRTMKGKLFRFFNGEKEINLLNVTPELVAQYISSGYEMQTREVTVKLSVPEEQFITMAKFEVLEDK